MSRCYVSIKNVSEEVLSVLGYTLVHETDDTKIYNHFGDEHIVDKSDPFLMMDDVNDAIHLGSEVIRLPGRLDED
jgi:hypothetical protein